MFLIEGEKALQQMHQDAYWQDALQKPVTHGTWRHADNIAAMLQDPGLAIMESFDRLSGHRLSVPKDIVETGRSLPPVQSAAYKLLRLVVDTKERANLFYAEELKDPALGDKERQRLFARKAQDMHDRTFYRDDEATYEIGHEDGSTTTFERNVWYGASSFTTRQIVMIPANSLQLAERDRTNVPVRFMPRLNVGQVYCSNSPGVISHLKVASAAVLRPYTSAEVQQLFNKT